MTISDLTSNPGPAEEASRDGEERLRREQLMEAVGQLAAGVAHDFNNLLAVIMLHGDLMLKLLAPEDPMRRRASEIKDAAERAAGLTRQLLAFSGRQILRPVALNLSEAVGRMCETLRRLLGAEVELLVGLEPEPGQVLADPGQIEQTVLSLAANARDAMPRGGRLMLRTKNVTLRGAAARRLNAAEGEYVLLSVGDTGCGMDAETLSRVFEPFFTTKEVGKGSGLGLSGVYGFVRQSGGHVAVESEPGAGTIFSIYLPRVEGAAQDGTAEAAMLAESANPSGTGTPQVGAL